MQNSEDMLVMIALMLTSYLDRTLQMYCVSTLWWNICSIRTESAEEDVGASDSEGWDDHFPCLSDSQTFKSHSSAESLSSLRPSE